MNNHTFCRLPVTSGQCKYGTEKHPDAAMLLNYDDDFYSLGYVQIKETFRALTGDDIFQPDISDNVFRSSIASVVDIGFILQIFDIGYQEVFRATHSIKVEFIFGGVVPKDINGYASVSTNKMVTASSDGQETFWLPLVDNIKFFHNIIIFLHC